MTTCFGHLTIIRPSVTSCNPRHTCIRRAFIILWKKWWLLPWYIKTTVHTNLNKTAIKNLLQSGDKEISTIQNSAI